MSSDVTALLQRVRAGDRGALDELMPLVYGELRRIARAFMRRQRPGHTLQPTALVNEAFIKLFARAQPEIVDRAHFLALMSRVMRQVLVDHARAGAAEKRGGDAARVPWDTHMQIRADLGAERLKMLDLHRALETLEADSAALAQIVEMHYFGGMTAEEVAVAVGSIGSRRPARAAVRARVAAPGACRMMRRGATRRGLMAGRERGHRLYLPGCACRAGTNHQNHQAIAAAARRTAATRFAREHTWYSIRRALRESRSPHLNSTRR